MKTLKEQYKSLICERTILVKEDLTPDENNIIDASFELWEEQKEELKLKSDELYFLSIKYKNLKSHFDSIQEDLKNKPEE